MLEFLLITLKSVTPLFKTIFLVKKKNLKKIISLLLLQISICHKYAY